MKHLIAIALTLLLGSCVSPTRAQAPAMPSDPDTVAWVAVRGPQDASGYLSRFASGRYSSIAKDVIADEAIIADVRRNSPGERFFIPEQIDSKESFFRSLGVKWARVMIVRDATGNLGTNVLAGSISRVIGFHDLRRENTIFTENKYTAGTQTEDILLGDGSVIVFKTAAGYVTESEPTDPLRFALIYRVGLVHIGGKGRVKSADGQVISIGRR